MHTFDISKVLLSWAAINIASNAGKPIQSGNQGGSGTSGTSNSLEIGYAAGCGHNFTAQSIVTTWTGSDKGIRFEQASYDALAFTDDCNGKHDRWFFQNDWDHWPTLGAICGKINVNGQTQYECCKGTLGTLTARKINATTDLEICTWTKC